MEKRQGANKVLEGPFPSTLDTALDNGHMSSSLNQVVEERFGKATQLTGLTIEHLERAVIRYKLSLINNVKQSSFEWTFMGKVYGSLDRMTNAFKIMRGLWDHGFSKEASDGVHVPEPIACIESVQVVLMEEVAGSVLRPLIKRMAATESQICKLALALAKIHTCPLRTGRSVTIEDRLFHRGASSNALAEAFPELAGDLDYIIETAMQVERRLGCHMTTLVHGDLHPGQVVVDNGCLWILDLDNMKDADPAWDLAKMFSFFKRTARKEKKSQYIDSLKELFIAEYFSVMDWEIARRIPLWEALVGLKRAQKCLRVQDEAGWEEKIKRLVEQSVASIRLMLEMPETLNRDHVVELYERSPGTV
ncbi:aminoglycoside phosphotransferase family protein [bacterium]|nr:aminoglycoside phosphotransferase family protein [bacterium]